jgi:hypothetical protein
MPARATCRDCGSGANGIGGVELLPDAGARVGPVDTHVAAVGDFTHEACVAFLRVAAVAARARRCARGAKGQTPGGGGSAEARVHSEARVHDDTAGIAAAAYGLALDGTA